MNGMLRVPGARLHYQTAGEGPPLLLITGAIMDSSGYAGLAEPLAERYSVISYDQRGNSRSPLEGPTGDQTIELRGDDAARLLEATANEPAYVLGCSSGALIGIDLVLRHPDRVRGLVAFEPPIPTLLPDRQRWAALYDEVVATYRREGLGPAMQTWIAGVGMDEAERPAPPADPTPEMVAAMARANANMVFFMEHELVPFSRYELDLERMRAAAGRIVLGAGQTSTPRQLPLQTTETLARLLGVEVTRFPGDHGGAANHPAAFARRLDECLRRLTAA